MDGCEDANLCVVVPRVRVITRGRRRAMIKMHRRSDDCVEKDYQLNDDVERRRLEQSLAERWSTAARLTLIHRHHFPLAVLTHQYLDAHRPFASITDKCRDVLFRSCVTEMACLRVNYESFHYQYVHSYQS